MKFLAIPILLLTLAITCSSNVSAYTVGEYYTCRGVEANNPRTCIGSTSEFLTTDTNVFVWASLGNLTKSYKLRFDWLKINEINYNGRTMYTHETSTRDPHSEGRVSYPAWYTWDYIPINTVNAIGKWNVTLAVDDKQVFNRQFVVKEDPNLIRRTETISLSQTVTATTFVMTQRGTILPFPLDIFILVSLIAVSFYSAYRYKHSPKPARQRDELFVGYLAKLEELKSRNEISQATYDRLKDEYWMQIKKLQHDE